MPDISNLSKNNPTVIAGEFRHYFGNLYFAKLSERSRDRPKWHCKFCKCSNNLKNIQNQGGSAHQSAFEVRDKFQQFFNSSSGSVPSQNESVMSG